MISVEVRDVAKRFGEVVALDRVSLKVEPGQLFFLLGPSGCGKTTLLRCLAGFYTPEEGSIHFGDSNVTKVPPHKRNTGMMFQSYALWPHMTVEKNVAFGLEQRKLPRREIRKQVGEALESVRMEKYRKRKPNQLSGGQQQRVALARALVVRPSCLLLDEPLSNLDAKLRHEMRLEIRRVCKEFGLTTIYVTHDQKEALSVADAMAVLDQGKLLQAGAPEQLYRRPAKQFVAEFIGETNFIRGTVSQSYGGTILVETPIGELQANATASEAPPKGEDVTLSIRPECLKLERFPVEENGFAGHIRETVYYGEMAQYGFRCRETTLKIYELNPRHLHQRGDELVYAWVDPDEVVILRD